MFTLPQNTIAYLLKEPVDMRYGMFRLQGVIAQLMQQPVPRGAFYFFINKGHRLLKAVWFDGTGLCLFCKRLEKGTFTWPQPASSREEKWMQITPSALSLLLDGIELKQCIKKAWHKASFVRKINGFRELANTRTGVFRRSALSFSKADKVQMLCDDNRHLRKMVQR